MSRFIISILLFFILGFLGTKAFLIHKEECNGKSNNLQEQTWTQWALSDFKKQKEHSAPIVILGSSLMLTPFNLADANFSNSVINGALHHKSDLLNSLLLNNYKNGVENFNFALPGLMPSDAYLITKLVLSSSNNPKLIVYGVGPRDFVDNLLASPTSTDPYHCLSNQLDELKDQDTKLDFIGKSWTARFDYFLGRLLPLYGHKDLFLEKLSEEGHDMMSSLLAVVLNGRVLNHLTVADVHNLLPDYDPMSININQALFQPNPKIDPNRFKRDLNEYKLRYGKINWDTFTCQSQFFVDFLKTARDHNIKVLILAMPITSVNRQLLPDYVFAAYKQNLSLLSKTYGAAYLDLDNSGIFKDEDFGDTVHLSTTGSIKLIHAIANSIDQYKLLSANNEPHKQLANAGLKL